jgi:hypothetical protein
MELAPQTVTKEAWDQAQQLGGCHEGAVTDENGSDATG